tara:strand:- start:5526 stop:5804 length:279 start_codon:yes stop_codon:yes gene_type:complete
MRILKQVIKLVVPFVWALAGVIVSVDIILAEFFKIGSAPDDSFVLSLIIFTIIVSSSHVKDEVFEHFTKGIVVYPIYIAFLLFFITKMMSWF